MKGLGEERARLYSETGEIVRLLFRRLRENSKFEQESSGEEVRLGMAILKCLSFQRSLIENRVGPKDTEKKQLDSIQGEVEGILHQEQAE